MDIQQRHAWFHRMRKHYGLCDLIMWDGKTPYMMASKHKGPRMSYACGQLPPHYPMPALPLKVEYVFGYGLADGIFVREEDYIVCGAYADGTELSPFELCYADLWGDNT